jgi:chromosome segregation ATPase
VSDLEQERQFAGDNVARLEENLRARDAEISHITQRVLERESELENLREEMSTIKREHAHLINEQTRALRDAVGQEDESKARVDQLVRAKAEADVEIKTSRDRIIVLKEEVERLRRHVHSLQQESADKEVKIVQMTKQHSLDKEDLQGLNIALDSKQQELELVCFFSF